MSKQNEAMLGKMDDFRVETGEDMNRREKSIIDKVGRVTAEIRELVERTGEEVSKKRMEMQEKYEKKFVRIKEVVTSYFQRYDVDLEEVKINMKVLNQKYTDWSKILIEPTSLNEARLYALETRVHEEEDMRIKEYEYLRDLMKKLIFSLEQTNLSSLDNG